MSSARALAEVSPCNKQGTLLNSQHMMACIESIAPEQDLSSSPALTSLDTYRQLCLNTQKLP